MGKSYFNFDDGKPSKKSKHKKKQHHKKKKAKKAKTSDDEQEEVNSTALQLCDVKFKRQDGCVKITVVVKKSELMSDERIEEIDRQREFEEKY